MEALETSDRFDTGGILLSQCRSELAEALDDLSAPPLKQPWGLFGWLRRAMVLRPVLSSSLLVLAGVAVGIELLPWMAARFDAASSAQTVRVLPTTRFTDEELAKMAVAGVSVTPSPDGAPGTLQVHMRTEEPLVISGSVDDPNMRRVLTYAVENDNQTDPGVRLDCLEALRQRTRDEDVRRALLYAARNDQSPAVRMKALDSLRDGVAEQNVRGTLIDALEHDANSGVRVEALNLLVHSLQASTPGAAPGAEPEVAPEASEPASNPSMEQVLRTLQALERNDPNPNVRLRSAAALRQIGSREVQ